MNMEGNLITTGENVEELQLFNMIIKATRPTVCSLCWPQGDVSAAFDPALAGISDCWLMNSQK